MKKLGVIGGLGPMATALFMRMVIEMTQAEIDQEHIEMVIYNCPQIPDRTSFILGNSSKDPTPEMIEIGKKLAEQGMDIIAIPCVTAHYFHDRLSKEIPVRIINIVDELCDYLKERGIHKVGLMATSGTVESRLFQKAMERSGMELIVPSDEGQKHVMHVIYENVKANKPMDMSRFGAASWELRAKGAEVIILGCTELSIVSETNAIGAGYIDAMRLLAKCAVEECGTLKPEWKELITQ